MTKGKIVIYLVTVVSAFVVAGLLFHPSQAQLTNNNVQPAMQPFPHVMYWGVGSDEGWPIVYDPNNTLNTEPSRTAPINPSVINDLTRAQLVTVPVTPSGDVRPDIVPALRAKNPDIKIFAYANVTTAWCPFGEYSSNMYYRHFFEVAMRWNTDGKPYSECPTTGPGFLFMTKDGVRTWTGVESLANVNYAHRVDNGDGAYTYDVAEAYADLMFQDIYEAHLYDGALFDCMCMTASWVVKMFAGYDVDYEYAGYSSVESFDDGWHQGVLRFNERFRQLVVAAGGTDFPVIGNCASPQGLFGDLNGWTREDFPYQGGGTWYTNMFNPNIGYLADERYFRRPSYSVNLMYPNDLNSIANRRRARFGTASTALGDGYSTVNHIGDYARPLPPSQQSLHWWMDEYSVNPLTAVATGDGSKIGWLGQPQGDYYQMIMPPTNPELVSGGTFTGGLNGWTTWADPATGSTFTPETGVGPNGQDAMRIHVTTVGPDYWKAQLISPATAGSTFTMNAGTEYSATLWAKADHRRAITIGMGNVAQYLPVTTQWQQYQVSMKSPTLQTNQKVILHFAADIGDVWVSDIHVNHGVTSVYRRDFDRGIVLVNPSETAQTVQLEKTYQKVSGTISPEINTGKSVSSVTLAAADPNNKIGDAVFLVDVDVTAPAAIDDLQV